MKNAEIGVRFVGTDLKPGSVAASELVEMITAFECLLADKALELDPNQKKEDLVVSLVSITDQSIGINFMPWNPLVLHSAITSISNDINQKDFSSYKGKQKDRVRSIINFSRRHNCEAHLIEGLDTPKTLAIITPDTELYAPALISGKTTVYGKIQSVGGKDPNVHVETPSGVTVICKVDIDQARILAGRLYDWVGLSGKARWDSEEFKIQDFIVESIINYSPGSARRGLDELRAIAGKYFSDIQDVNKFVGELRNDDLEG